MKKYTPLIITVAILALNFSAFAQENNKPAGKVKSKTESSFSIGPEGGPGMEVLWHIGAPYGANITSKIALGGAAGYAFQYNFTKMFSIRASLDYERKGGNLHIASPYVQQFELIAHFKYDYLTLPILARATFGKKVKFFVNVGPYFGLLLNGVFTEDLPGYGTIINNETTSYNRFDFGVCAGAGVAIPFLKMYSVSFEARNNLGVINIAGTSGIDDLRTNSSCLIVAFNYFMSPHKRINYSHKDKINGKHIGNS